MGVIPGYLTVGVALAAAAVTTLFVMVWLHRKSGICVALGLCVVSGALVIDASTGAAWMGGRWLLFLSVGGGLIVLGVIAGFFSRRTKTGRKPNPPDAVRTRQASTVG
jgi:hypothetical protein